MLENYQEIFCLAAQTLFFQEELGTRSHHSGIETVHLEL